MKIGTDCSIPVCRSEGYMVIEFNKKELMPNGVMNKDYKVALTASNPEAWYDNGKVKFQAQPIYLLDEEYSWNDLVKILKSNDREKSVANYADWKNYPINFDAPDEQDFLTLASDLHSCFNLSLS
jgi:hypothetical protein